MILDAALSYFLYAILIYANLYSLYLTYNVIVVYWQYKNVIIRYIARWSPVIVRDWMCGSLRNYNYLSRIFPNILNASLFVNLFL